MPKDSKTESVKKSTSKKATGTRSVAKSTRTASVSASVGRKTPANAVADRKAEVRVSHPVEKVEPLENASETMMVQVARMGQKVEESTEAAIQELMVTQQSLVDSMFDLWMQSFELGTHWLDRFYRMSLTRYARLRPNH